MMSYYTLLQREDDVWGIQFGSYSYGEVKFEKQTLLESGNIFSKDLCILRTETEDQSVIDAMVAEKNEAYTTEVMRRELADLRIGVSALGDRLKILESGIRSLTHRLL